MTPPFPSAALPKQLFQNGNSAKFETLFCARFGTVGEEKQRCPGYPFLFLLWARKEERKDIASLIQAIPGLQGFAPPGGVQIGFPADLWTSKEMNKSFFSRDAESSRPPKPCPALRY